MSSTIPADLGRARRAVDLLLHSRGEHMPGCPLGCELGRHEPPCLVSEPIEHDFGKYRESAIFVAFEGGVRLTSLLRWVA